jgi:predicted phage terminase large subunit-like protein
VLHDTIGSYEKQDLELDINSQVLTPFGWKDFGAIEMGDQVCNPDGTVSRVIGIYDNGVKPFYKFTFHDGEVVYADDEHVWPWRSTRRRKNRKRKLNRLDTYVDDDQVAETWNHNYGERFNLATSEQLFERFKKLEEQNSSKVLVGNDGFEKLCVPVCNPQMFTLTCRTELLDPYVLGCLLGDGCITGGIDRNTEANSGTISLASLKLSGTDSYSKFIPKQYLFSSIENRYELAKGLMDTNGTVDDRGHCEYNTSSKQLSETAAHLFRSLGYLVTISTKISNYEYKGEIKQGALGYILQIKGRDTHKLFSLPRKVERARIRYANKTDIVDPGNIIINIQEVKPGFSRCIKVDNPNGLYVTDNFVVTHNTTALLASALQYADHPKYSGIILMKNFANLDHLAGISKDWLQGTGAEWYESKHKWIFPEGGVLRFGNVDREDDVYKYRSFEYQFMGFDEVTRLSGNSYLLCTSRVRTNKNINIPQRIRAATNPGGGAEGHAFIKGRFIDPDTRKPETLFIPATLWDNPHLDVEEYVKTLEELPIVERERLMNGDWDINDSEAMISEGWFNKISVHDVPQVKSREGRIRVWDIAATQVSAKNRDPDYTASALCSVSDGTFSIENATFFRGSPRMVEDRIILQYREDAVRFGRAVPTFIEMGNNSAAKMAVDQLLRGPFAGLEIKAITSNVSKEERARPFAVAAENGNVNIVVGDWNKHFFTECVTFGKKLRTAHDDIIDCVVHAYNRLVVLKRKQARIVSSSGSKFNVPTRNRLQSLLR